VTELDMTTPANDPRALLAVHRQHLLALAAPGPGDSGPLSDLPDPIRRLVDVVEASQPGRRVDVYWYVDLNGTDTAALGDLAAVSGDDVDAVVLSHTDTVLTNDAATVRSMVALGRRSRGSAR
jgi:hypothetical protein